MKLLIPLRLPSLSNVRLHWRAMSSLKKKQKRVTRLVLSRVIMPPCPLTITITRIGPMKLDGDNLQASCKYVRDEIARAVGVDDGSDVYTWNYEQRIGTYGVEVLVETREF
jgi:hypothetical protein